MRNDNTITFSCVYIVFNSLYILIYFFVYIGFNSLYILVLTLCDLSFHDPSEQNPKSVSNFRTILITWVKPSNGNCGFKWSLGSITVNHSDELVVFFHMFNGSKLNVDAIIDLTIQSCNNNVTSTETLLRFKKKKQFLHTTKYP